MSDENDLVDAFLTASRVLVAVAARSLEAAQQEVTLPQYRALVVLASRGPQRMSDLAQHLRVNSSTATRHCDRLERIGLIRREKSEEDRRSVCASLTPMGWELIDQVTTVRREEIRAILESMSGEHLGRLLVALRAFGDAAGEVPEQSWSLGWGTDQRSGVHVPA